MAEVFKADALKDGDGLFGNRTKAKIVKNKVAPPFKIAEFDIMYGEGISKYGEMVDLGAEYNIIKKSGSWFSYGEDRIGQGKENARKFIEENPDIMREIEDKIKSMKNEDLFREENDADEDEDEELFDVNGEEEDEDDGDFSIKLTDIDGD